MGKVIPITTKMQRPADVRGLSIEEITEEYLERQSDENLIRLAVQAVNEIERAQKTLDMAKLVLDGRFDQQAVTEHIASEFGFAERKVRNQWSMTGSMDDLQQMLGKMYSSYVEESREVSIVPDKAAELFSVLGEDYQDFFIIQDVFKPSKSFINVVRDPKSPAASPKVLKVYRPYVAVDTKAKVNIKPVVRKEA